MAIRTFLLTWNPSRWNFSDAASIAAALRRGEHVRDEWACRNRQATPGDRFFLLRQGSEPRGIVASGTFLTAPVLRPHWDEAKRAEGKLVPMADIQYEALIDVETSPPFPRDRLDELPFSLVHWRTQQSGIHIRDDVASLLEAEWRAFLGADNIFPDEIPDQDSEALFEGAKVRVFVNAFERNSEARRRCIEHYGRTCQVCGMDFASRYGPQFSGLIHVHHEKPLASIGEDYLVDPIADLKPVCPSCHAALHYKRPQPFTVDELRERWLASEH